jgi:hypothetical protein
MMHIHRFKSFYQISPSQGPVSFFVALGKALSLFVLLFSLIVALMKQIWLYTDQWIFMAGCAFLGFTILGWFFRPKPQVIDL